MPLSAAQKDKLAQIVAHLDQNADHDSDSLLSIALEILDRESRQWVVIARRGLGDPPVFVTAGAYVPNPDAVNAPLVKQLALLAADIAPKRPEMTLQEVEACIVQIASARTREEAADALAHYITECIEREPDGARCAAEGIIGFSNAMTTGVIEERLSPDDQKALRDLLVKARMAQVPS